MPSCPTASPAKTEVTAKPSPPTMPTRPLALARSASGTSRVTTVERAMPRADSVTEPISSSTAKRISGHEPRVVRADRGESTKTPQARAKSTRVMVCETTMTDFLRVRSTQEPKGTPITATSSR